MQRFDLSEEYTQQQALAVSKGQVRQSPCFLGMYVPVFAGYPLGRCFEGTNQREPIRLEFVETDAPESSWVCGMPILTAFMVVSLRACSEVVLKKTKGKPPCWGFSHFETHTQGFWPGFCYRAMSDD